MQLPTPPLTLTSEPFEESKIGIVSQRQAQLLVRTSSFQAIFCFLGDANEICEFYIDKVRLENGVVLSLPQHNEHIQNLLLGIANLEPIGFRTSQLQHIGPRGILLGSFGRFRINVKMARYNVGLNGESLRRESPIETYDIIGDIVVPV
jgi:hypothetical protein